MTSTAVMMHRLGVPTGDHTEGQKGASTESSEVGWGHKKAGGRQSLARTKSLAPTKGPRAARESGPIPPEVRVQRLYRSRLYRERLHRRNLADRLLFESAMVRGTFRLINQALIFWLMVAAALMGGNVEVRRGIYTNFQDAFRLKQLRDIESRLGFVEALPALSQKSKDFFLLSSRYFDTEEAGFVQLLGPLQTFSVPKHLSVDITIQAQSLSFTAWVRTSPLFVKGYIVRKRLLPAGYGSEFSCWGWYLDRRKGAQFHYGVHDIFPIEPSDGKLQQVEAKLESPPEFRPGQFTLITAIVTQTNVTFWSNLEELGSVRINRPLTDCFNDADGE